MKKLVILAAVAVMAFGAQAFVYNFQFQLDNIPTYGTESGHPNHDIIYLADNNNNVYCYVYRGTLDGTGGDMKKAEGTEGKKIWTLASDSGEIKHNDTPEGKFHALDGQTVLDHSLKAADIEKCDNNGRLFVVSFTSEQDLGEHVKIGKTIIDGKEYDTAVCDGLKIVVTNAEEPNGMEYKVDYDLGVTVTNPGGGSAGYLLAGYAAYPVPEPTSAMLLLLGVAGLALKRKVA